MSSSTDEQQLSTSDHSGLSSTYEEIALESRKIQGNFTTGEETIVIGFFVDPDEEAAASDSVFLGAEDDVVALEKAYSIFPDARILPKSDGSPLIMTLSNIRLEEKNQAAHLWHAIGTYSYQSNKGFGGSGGLPASGPSPSQNVLPQVRIGFQTGGQTRNVKRSINTLLGEVHDDFHDDGLFVVAADQNIGATQDGIEGVDIPAGVLRIQITAYYRPSFIGMDFLDTLVELSNGTYNNATFLNRPEGEVSLVDASGGATVGDLVPITFDFLIKKNKTDEPDEGFPDINAKGHDIIDYRFERVFDDEGGNIVIQKPKIRYIHQVLKPADYTQLGFGAAPNIEQ